MSPPLINTKWGPWLSQSVTQTKICGNKVQFGKYKSHPEGSTYRGRHCTSSPHLYEMALLSHLERTGVESSSPAVLSKVHMNVAWWANTLLASLGWRLTACWGARWYSGDASARVEVLQGADWLMVTSSSQDLLLERGWAHRLEASFRAERGRSSSSSGQTLCKPLSFRKRTRRDTSSKYNIKYVHHSAWD